MTVSHVATYRPTWEVGGDRVAGRDEDAVTMTVAVVRAVIDAGFEPHAIVVVTHEPALLVGSNGAVVLRALRLPDSCRYEELVGGADLMLQTICDRSAGTIVVGVDPVGAGAAAGAAAIGHKGMGVSAIGRVHRSLPIQVQAPRQPDPQVYDDPRLLRERGWKRAVEALSPAAQERLVIAGVPSKAAAALGGERDLATAATADGASSVPFALAAIAGANDAGVNLVALDGASAAAAAVRLGEGCVIHRIERPATQVPQQSDGGPAALALSLPAYDRAFEYRIGLMAARCECGTLSLPPRVLCLGCGAMDRTTPVALPRTATVYTVTTVHAPVPGMRSPYTLAICELGDTGVRLLAPVADAAPGTTVIGDSGTMELRRLSERQGVPDYGYAFIPDLPAGKEMPR